MTTREIIRWREGYAVLFEHCDDRAVIFCDPEGVPTDIAWLTESESEVDSAAAFLRSPTPRAEPGDADLADLVLRTWPTLAARTPQRVVEQLAAQRVGWPAGYPHIFGRPIAAIVERATAAERRQLALSAADCGEFHAVLGRIAARAEVPWPMPVDEHELVTFPFSRGQGAARLYGASAELADLVAPLEWVAKGPGPAYPSLAHVAGSVRKREGESFGGVLLSASDTHSGAHELVSRHHWGGNNFLEPLRIVFPGTDGVVSVADAMRLLCGARRRLRPVPHRGDMQQHWLYALVHRDQPTVPLCVASVGIGALVSSDVCRLHARLQWVATRPDYRRRGLASYLLNDLGAAIGYCVTAIRPAASGSRLLAHVSTPYLPVGISALTQAFQGGFEEGFASLELQQEEPYGPVCAWAAFEHFQHPPARNEDPDPNVLPLAQIRAFSGWDPDDSDAVYEIGEVIEEHSRAGPDIKALLPAWPTQLPDIANVARLDDIVHSKDDGGAIRRYVVASLTPEWSEEYQESGPVARRGFFYFLDDQDQPIAEAECSASGFFGYLAAGNAAIGELPEDLLPVCRAIIDERGMKREARDAWGDVTPWREADRAYVDVLVVHTLTVLNPAVTRLAVLDHLARLGGRVVCLVPDDAKGAEELRSYYRSLGAVQLPIDEDETTAAFALPGRRSGDHPERSSTVTPLTSKRSRR